MKNKPFNYLHQHKDGKGHFFLPRLSVVECPDIKQLTQSEDGRPVLCSWRREGKHHFVVHFASVDQQADANVEVNERQPNVTLARRSTDAAGRPKQQIC